MSTSTLPATATISDLLESLGDIPASRVRWTPTPGTATIEDLLKRGNERCELIDGTLVEKPMGWIESFLGSKLLTLINSFVMQNNLGVVTSEQGSSQLFPGTIRIPDIAFTSWQRLPNRRLPTEPIPNLVPDLTVEVLSPSNSVNEMLRKRQEYFQAGVQQVWEVDPRARKIFVYASVDDVAKLSEGDTLTGGDQLPGFALPLTLLFTQD